MFHKMHGQSKNASKHFEVIDAVTRVTVTSNTTDLNKEMPKI